MPIFPTPKSHIKSRLVRLGLLASEPIVLVNVRSLPGVVDPDVANGRGSRVTLLKHVVGKLALLGLVLVLQLVSIDRESFVSVHTWSTKMLNWVLGAGALAPMR